MITVERKVRFAKGGRGRKEALPEAERTETQTGCVPRVARLMALAIRFDQLIRDGEVANQAEMARVGHVTRTKPTQIMNLLLLAPEIQEAVLFLPTTRRGRDVVKEWELRPIAVEPSWSKQWKLCRSFLLTAPCGDA